MSWLKNAVSKVGEKAEACYSQTYRQSLYITELLYVYPHIPQVSGY